MPTSLLPTTRARKHRRWAGALVWLTALAGCGADDDKGPRFDYDGHPIADAGANNGSDPRERDLGPVVDNATAGHGPTGPVNAHRDERAAADDEAGDADPYRLLGRRVWPWRLTQWANSPPLSWTQLRGKTLVVRFFTCDEASARSLLALQRMNQDFRSAPVCVIGIYDGEAAARRTGERPGENPFDRAVRWAVRHGIELPLAYDETGFTVRRWWAERFELLPRSATFVFTPEGRVAHVHPGPEFFPTDDPMLAICDRDYDEIAAAVRRTLPESVASRTEGAP